MEKCKAILSAKILDSTKQIEVFEWLAFVAPEYGTKPFNKRFETWLNKKAGERFGTKTLKNWGVHGEDKEFPKVSFYMHKADYQLTYEVKYELSVNYDGKEASYDYDTKTTVIRDRSQNEKLFGLVGVDDLVVWANRIVTNRRESIEKMQGNLKYLPKLMAMRDRLQMEIKDYNDKISYAISDEMRIK